MNTGTSQMPRIAVQSIGGGLLLMALFTMMWTGIAQGGLQGRDHQVVLATFSALSVAFVVYGVRLFIVARDFPKVTTEQDRLEGKSMLKAFGIIFGIEGTAIPIACGLLVVLDESQFILPAIALIVGLHFYPMAKIFKRSIDYYLASWTCLVAVTGMYMTWTHVQPEGLMLTFLGIGVASATTTYGLYMIWVGYGMVNQKSIDLKIEDQRRE